jgi:N-dimethylarginine dimethylaminohydrolase
MITLDVRDETAPLHSVIIGIAEQLGGVPTLEASYDPKSRQHIRAGTYPKEEDMIEELEGFVKALRKHGVKVYRPHCLPKINQVYARDIGFVIDDYFIKAIMIEKRKEEIHGIDWLRRELNPERVLIPPPEVHLEGGDVMPWDDHIFVGYSKKEDFEKYEVARTNELGVRYLEDHFPKRKVKSFELVKSDEDPYENALHLDCCFQPIGKGHAICYPGGFKNQDDVEWIKGYFGDENIIEISREEMYDMNSNIFSVSPEIIISEVGFTRLNEELESRGFQVEKIKFSEISKMEGLLRCTSLPLERSYN